MKDAGICVVGFVSIVLMVALAVTIRHWAPYIAGAVVIVGVVWLYNRSPPNQGDLP